MYQTGFEPLRPQDTEIRPEDSWQRTGKRNNQHKDHLVIVPKGNVPMVTCHLSLDMLDLHLRAHLAGVLCCRGACYSRWDVHSLPCPWPKFTCYQC